MTVPSDNMTLADNNDDNLYKAYDDNATCSDVRINIF